MEEVNEKLIDHIKKGRHEQAIQLLDNQPKLMFQKTHDGLSLLMFSAYHKAEKLVSYLLERLPELDLFEAAATGQIHLVKDFIKEDPDQVNDYAPDGFTALGLAAYFGHTDVVALLIENGADVNQVSNNGMEVAPLHAAVAHRHMPITKILLEHGANANARQKLGVTALHSAAHQGDSEIIELLLKYQADREAEMDNGKKPVDLAIEVNHPELVHILNPST